MESRIPKIIHYCWFGGNPLPDDAKRYIETWKKHCPGYEIKEWNEKNFDIHCNTYVEEAYEAKRWAFVSDYARLVALVNEGGIYLDTDVEVIKPFDDLLTNNAFIGFERKKNLATAIIGAEKGSSIFKEFLQYYEGRHFKLDDGYDDTLPNVQVLTKICQNRGLFLNNTRQSIDGCEVFPCEFFSPKNYFTEKIEITENTYTIHHYVGSWRTEDNKELFHLQHKYGEKIGQIIFMPKKFVRDCKKNGIKNTIKHVIYILFKREL